jgi:hypothetical protein
MEFFEVKCRKKLSDAAHEALRCVMERTSTPIKSIGVTRRHLESTLGISIVKFHRCFKGCMLFTGKKHFLRRRCRYCQTSRFIEDGDTVMDDFFANEEDLAFLTPRAVFEYIPLIPRLQLLYAHPIYAEKMRYPHTLWDDPWDDGIRDLWEGQIMKDFKANGMNTFISNANLRLLYR